MITIDTGANSESATIATVGTAGAGGTGVTLTAPLTKAHAIGALVPLPRVGCPVRDDQGRRPRPRRDRRTCPLYWDRTDAWYNFTANVRGVSHVLATVVEDPFGPQPQGQVLDGIAGGTMGADHPVSWCKDYKGGRSFYTALGNTADSFDEADFRTHLEGAIDWAAGVADPVYSDCGATVLANYQQVKISGPPNLSEPIGFDQLPDGRVIQTDRRGGVHLHNPATGTSQILATRPRLHAERGRPVRPGHRPQLLDEPLGLPLLRPAERRQHHLLRRDDGTHQQLRRGLRPVEQRGSDPGASASPTSTPGSGTSSCRGSSSSTTPRATRRTSTWRPSSRSCASR